MTPLCATDAGTRTLGPALMLALSARVWQSAPMMLQHPLTFLAPLAVVVVLSAGGAAAQSSTGLTGQEFEDYTTGKVLTYGVAGAPYGIEQYLPGRKVVWAFVGDQCRTGTWYEKDRLICFIYDDRTDDPQCWSFFLGSQGLKAHFAGDENGEELIEVQQSNGPMPCPGPDLGV
jgi:hypothetical protein